MCATWTSWCYLWEVAGAVADEQTCLATAAVADDNKLLGVGRRLRDGGVVCVRRGIGAHSAVAVALAGSADGFADGGDGGHWGLDALLAAQIVIVGGGSGLGRHGEALSGYRYGGRRASGSRQE